MPLLAPKKPTKKLSRKDQSLARLENYKKEISTDFHMITIQELCERLQTDMDSGLTPAMAKKVLQRTGPNTLTPPKKKSALLRYLYQIFHGFSMLLWIGAGLCYLSVLVLYLTTDKVDYDNVILGGVLIVVVVITGSFMYYQERKSQAIMESFANMVPPKANVIRGGTFTTISCKEVVVGDLVDIKFGDRVPADVRLVQSQGLKVDNSPLTGESEPQPRGKENAEENFLESKNIVFFSTNVVEGTGRGIVVGCGDQTVMGRIAGLTARLKPNKTPLAKELDHFMRVISVWACTLGVVLGIASLSLGRSLIDTILFVIGIIVANVPEGLLATVIVCLTVTAKKMAIKNCLIKNLEAVETLGSTSIICSDKTGTLTQNRMTVAFVWCSFKVLEADSPMVGTKSIMLVDLLIRCAALCNRAEFLTDKENMAKPIWQRTVRGDASEEAILKFIEMYGGLEPNFRQRNRKLIEIPFSSATKYQVSVHALERGACLVVMKGAPEMILERCSSIQLGNETKEMSRDTLNGCHKACLKFAEMGMRVLGFCDLVLEDRFTAKFPYSTEPSNFPLRGLRFLGLMALIDPARPQVPDAIKKCKSAGIKVAMVTGDHPVTAKAIALKVGILSENREIKEFHKVKEVRRMGAPSSELCGLVIHGSVLRDILGEELDNLLFNYPEIVFARTSPTQKLQIVESYQRLGEIVAVTGDGVNDAPALKKADIGIAMGITGTEVSQQAADIILLDDNFASIITGIEEGRKIFDNLKKSITYTLASNVPEILPFLAYTFLNLPLPLGVIAILCIDILTDMMPAISLAYEKSESDIMQRPPRNPKRDKLVSRKLYFLAYGHLGIIEALGAFFTYFVIMAEHGFLPLYLMEVGDDSKWENRDVNVTDHYGRTWTYGQRLTLQYICFTAVMNAVVVTQWFNLIACKTRLNSIVTQGMGNWVLNVSLVVETVFAAGLTYIPGTYYLKFWPLRPRWWFYAMPYGLGLLLFDEFRKGHIRKYPRGWYQRETSY